MVIDGCASKGIPYAPKVLNHYGATPDIIVLTHPHLDHARGVQEIVDEFTHKVEPHKWPKLGMLFPPMDEGAGDFSDLQRHYEGGVTQLAISAIIDRWERSPACRWHMNLGDTLPLGDATITVVSPTKATRRDVNRAWRTRRRFDWNRAATALLLRWKDWPVVLGSDLIEIPGNGWSRAVKLFPELNAHSVLKVPHHGSRKAQDKGLLKRARGSRSPAWVITPFASSGLPRFDEGEGGTKLLSYVPKLNLTALPRGYSGQAGTPLVIRHRSLIRKHSTLQMDTTGPGFPDRFVGLSISRDGKIEFEYGLGSVIVER